MVSNEVLNNFFETSNNMLSRIFNILDNSSISEDEQSELHRIIHTYKSEFSTIGALEARDLIHRTESLMDKVKNGISTFNEIKEDVILNLKISENIINNYKQKKYDYSFENFNIAKIEKSQKFINEAFNILNAEPFNIEEFKEKILFLRKILPESKLKQYLNDNLINATNLDIKDYKKILTDISKMLELVLEGDINYYEDIIQINQSEMIKNINNILNKKQEIKEETIDIGLSQLDNLIHISNEMKILNSSLETFCLEYKNTTLDLKENNFNLNKLIKELNSLLDLKINAIKKSSKLDENFDPLELDQYNRIHELVRMLSEANNDTNDIYMAINKKQSVIFDINENQSKRITNLQDNLMQKRLVKFITYKDYFIATINQAAQELNKEINIDIIGETIEVDKFILDKLKSVLSHVLRNSVDHGIETKEERITNGKTPIGTIKIMATLKDGNVILTIEDDGRGISIDKIREKAISLGLWKENSPMNNQQAINMINLPKFSTAEKLTQHSGRGVGLDAVKEQVLSMGGQYESYSEEGNGMKTIIKIPTMISSFSALLVNVCGYIYSIPLSIIDYVGSTTELSNKEHYKYKNEELEIYNMSDLLGLKDSNTGLNNFLVLSEDQSKIVIKVEKIIEDIKDIPIKQLNKSLSNVPGIIGATILSNGEPSFIVNPIKSKKDLLKYLGSVDALNKYFEENFRATHDIDLSNNYIMVVDDSITIRKSYERFLVKEKYDVILAKDGQDALEKLVYVNPDAILLDVEMPRMDGFEFLKYIRDNKNYQDIPVIMITSRISEKHKNYAFSIGVNEYIGKPFNESEMLALLAKYIKKDEV